MNWLPYPKCKAELKLLRHYLISVCFRGGDNKYHAEVWSAIYTRNGFEQLQVDGRLLPIDQFTVADLTVQGVIPYPEPLPLPKKKQSTYDLLD
jgi:hypothetical protein